MNPSTLHQIFDGLATAGGDALGPQQLADVVWLAASLRAGQAGPAPTKPKPIKPPIDSKEQKAGPSAPPKQGAAGSPKALRAVPGGGESGEIHMGMPLRIPVARMLGGASGIGTGLRPLGQRRDVGARAELLEEETATRIAEEGIFDPLFKQQRERTLHLNVVLDGSESMETWFAFTHEFVVSLERLGLFSGVKAWTMRWGGEGSRLFHGLPPSEHDPISRSAVARPLIGEVCGGAVILVSDCAGPHWYDGRAAEELNSAAGEHLKLALLQVLPEALWRHTGLAAARPFVIERARTEAPPPTRQAGISQAGTSLNQWSRPVTVVTLRQRSLARWARLAAGVGSGRNLTPGYCFKLNPVPRQRSAPLAPPDFLKRFLQAASPGARRLARVAAAAQYLTLPMLHKLSEVVLGAEGHPSQVAELTLSGLLRRASRPVERNDADQVRYVFAKSARAKLLDVLPLAQASMFERTCAPFLNPAARGTRIAFQNIRDPYAEEASFADDDKGVKELANLIYERVPESIRPVIRYDIPNALPAAQASTPASGVPGQTPQAVPGLMRIVYLPFQDREDVEGSKSLYASVASAIRELVRGAPEIDALLVSQGEPRAGDDQYGFLPHKIHYFPPWASMTRAIRIQNGMNLCVLSTPFGASKDSESTSIPELESCDLKLVLWQADSSVSELIHMSRMYAAKGFHLALRSFGKPEPLTLDTGLLLVPSCLDPNQRDCFFNLIEFNAQTRTLVIDRFLWNAKLKSWEAHRVVQGSLSRPAEKQSGPDRSRTYGFVLDQHELNQLKWFLLNCSLAKTLKVLHKYLPRHYALAREMLPPNTRRESLDESMLSHHYETLLRELNESRIVQDFIERMLAVETNEKLRMTAAALELVPPKGRYVLVVGGTDTTAAVDAFAADVGRSLKRGGYGLVTGVWNGVDQHVSRGFGELWIEKPPSRPGERLLLRIVESSSASRIDENERAIVVEDNEWQKKALSRADAVILINGQGYTLEIGRLAGEYRKPVLPVPDFGGDSEAIYNEMLKRASRGTVINGVGTSELMELGSPQLAHRISTLLDTVFRRLDQARSEKEQRARLATPKSDPDDIQKGRWGGKPESGGYRLSAHVERYESDKDWFKVEIEVRSVTEKPFSGAVEFHLHQTFPNSKRTVYAKRGVARLQLSAYGAFTVGAVVRFKGARRGVKLELDLSKLSGAPAAFIKG